MAENLGREFHAVADLFPLMQGEAFAELVADIKKNGLREPILVDAKGRILDGRNRYRACLEAGAKPRFEQWKGEGDPADLALSLNLRRRHLDESQRAMVAARLAKMLQATRPARGANLHHAKSLRSHDEAASTVNVSRRLLMHASKVLAEGSPELIAAVDSGAMAVSTASALAGSTHEEQKQAVAGGVKEAARKVRELRGEKDVSETAEGSPFGIVDAQPPDGPDGVRLLWVSAPALTRAVKILKAGGFRYTPGEG